MICTPPDFLQVRVGEVRCTKRVQGQTEASRATTRLEELGGSLSELSRNLVPRLHGPPDPIGGPIRSSWIDNYKR